MIDKQHGATIPTVTNDHLDERDTAILAARVAKLDARPGPRVGDFVRLHDGTLRRFTYRWGDGDATLQTTSFTPDGKPFGSESFYLSGNGFADYSGSLDPGLRESQVRDTGETRPGRCWFFHHDFARAHNGIDVIVTFRVFEEI